MLSRITAGTATDVSILKLAQIVDKVTGFEGALPMTQANLMAPCGS